MKGSLPEKHSDKGGAVTQQGVSRGSMKAEIQGSPIKASKRSGTQREVTSPRHSSLARKDAN